MRVVIDTNVLISAFLASQSAAHKALRHAQQNGVLLSSKPTENELAEVLFRPKFDRYLSKAKRVDLLTGYLAGAMQIEISTEVVACRDPKDDKFLALAVSGNANIILTGDNDLLTLHPFRQIAILSPADFIAQ